MLCAERRRWSAWQGSCTSMRRPESDIALERGFELADSEFQRLRELVHARTGIALSDAKRELVYGRLARRLRKLGLVSFAQYRDLLEQPGSGEMEELIYEI